jgi:hypothetical protein
MKVTDGSGDGMRPIVFMLAFCAALIANFAETSAAQSFVPAPNGTFVLDFDSEDGNFSLWRVDDLTGINTMRARATLVRKGHHDRWAPSFTIALGDDQGQARLSIIAAPNSGPLIIQSALIQGQSRSQEDNFALTPHFQEAFDIHVEWTAEGVVTFTVFSRAAQGVNGYERRQVSLGRGPTTLSITGSTGEVLFDPLQLGRLSP